MVVTNDSLFILVPSNPDSIRNISQTLSSSPLKRPNPKRVQLAGVRKRGSRNLALIEIAFELRLFKKIIILLARTSTSSEFQVTQVERLAAQRVSPPKMNFFLRDKSPICLIFLQRVC